MCTVSPGADSSVQPSGGGTCNGEVTGSRDGAPSPRGPRAPRTHGSPQRSQSPIPTRAPCPRCAALLRHSPVLPVPSHRSPSLPVPRGFPPEQPGASRCFLPPSRAQAGLPGARRAAPSRRCPVSRWCRRSLPVPPRSQLPAQGGRVAPRCPVSPAQPRFPRPSPELTIVSSRSSRVPVSVSLSAARESGGGGSSSARNSSAAGNGMAGLAAEERGPAPGPPPTSGPASGTALNTETGPGTGNRSSSGPQRAGGHEDAQDQPLSRCPVPRGRLRSVGNPAAPGSSPAPGTVPAASAHTERSAGVKAEGLSQGPDPGTRPRHRLGAAPVSWRRQCQQAAAQPGKTGTHRGQDPSPGPEPLSSTRRVRVFPSPGTSPALPAVQDKGSGAPSPGSGDIGLAGARNLPQNPRPCPWGHTAPRAELGTQGIPRSGGVIPAHGGQPGSPAPSLRGWPHCRHWCHRTRCSSRMVTTLRPGAAPGRRHRHAGPTGAPTYQPRLPRGGEAGLAAGPGALMGLGAPGQPSPHKAVGPAGGNALVPAPLLPPTGEPRSSTLQPPEAAPRASVIPPLVPQYHLHGSQPTVGHRSPALELPHGISAALSPTPGPGAGSAAPTHQGPPQHSPLVSPTWPTAPQPPAQRGHRDGMAALAPNVTESMRGGDTG